MYSGIIASGSNNLNSLHVNLFITFYGRGSPRPGIKHSFTLRFVSLSLQWALLSTQIHAQVNTDHKFANWWCLTGGLHMRSQRFTYRAHCRCSRISLMLLAVPTRCLFCYGRRATDGIPIDVFLLLSFFFAVLSQCQQPDSFAQPKGADHRAVRRSVRWVHLACWPRQLGQTRDWESLGPNGVPSPHCCQSRAL